MHIFLVTPPQASEATFVGAVPKSVDVEVHYVFQYLFLVVVKARDLTERPSRACLHRHRDVVPVA